MEHKNIIASVIVLLLITAGMFVFAYLKKTELQKLVPQEIIVPVVVSPYADITRIDAKHFFRNGTHTVVGEIRMPTACDLLHWTTRIEESNPETVTIDFDVINESTDCVPTPTAQRFKVSFNASELATIKATLEVLPVTMNLILASDDESPDDFELFIKG